MSARARVSGDRIRLRLDAAESALLADLASQLAGITASPEPGRDPALDRLLPDAYPDDAAASAEFGRYTRGDLLDGKTANARAVAAALTGSSRTVELDAESADRWTRTLTDLRLVLAERLGIESDEDVPRDAHLGAVYDWLGGLQWSLVDALDELERHARRAV